MTLQTTEDSSTKPCPTLCLNGKLMVASDVPPLCMGSIVEDSNSYSVNGVPVALNGMKTTYSAKLIASGSWASIHR